MLLFGSYVSASQTLPNSITVEGHLGLCQYPEGIELVPQGTLARYELCSIGAVQTVYTVHSQNTSLIPANEIFTVAITPVLFLTATHTHTHTHMYVQLTTTTD